MTRPGRAAAQRGSFTSVLPAISKTPKEAGQEEANAGLLKHHALVTLLACGVPTVLGTDGGGVEHSDMAREYALAQAVLTQATALVDQEDAMRAEAGRRSPQ